MKLITLSMKITFSIIFSLCLLNFSFGQNATNGGEIGYDQTIYPGEIPEPLVNITPASGGNTNLDLEYIWHIGSISMFPQGWEIASGNNDEVFYNPPALNQTTYFYRIARRNGFTEYIAGSNVVSITVLPGIDNAGIIGSNQIVMINEQPDTLFEIQPPSGGNPNADFEYEWVKLSSTTTLEPAEGIIDQPFYLPPPLTETTIFVRKVRRAGTTGYIQSNQVTIEVEPTSIDGLKNKVIQVYPNPTTNYLQIEFKENDSPNWLVEVFDIKGSLLKTRSLENVNLPQSINLQDLAKGTYLIQITDLENNKMESVKVVKE